MNIFQKIYERLHDKLTRRRRNRRWLAFATTFRDAGSSLSSFYLPLFFYKTAQEFAFWPADFSHIQKGMVLICFYYLVQRLVSGTANFIQAKFALKTGHEQAMILGTAFRALWLLSLSYIQTNPWLILVATVLAGADMGFFWPSYKTLICRLSLSKEIGKSLALFRFIGNFLAMITPALGGLIIGFFGYDYLFYVSTTFVLVSLIGTIQLDIKDEKDEVNLEEYKDWMKEKRFNLLMVSQAGKYFYDLSIVLWPLFVFLLLGDITRVGYIYSFTLFLVLFINLLMGNNLDGKKKIKKSFYISGGILSVITVLRTFTTGAWDVVIVDSCNRMLGNLYWLMHDKFMYARGKGSQDFSYFVYSEVNRSIAAVFFWTFALLFFLIFDIEWTGLFALGSVGVLFSLLLKDTKEAS